MIDIGIEALLIMDKAGIPLLFQKLNPRKSDIEPVLLSGFLTAVKSFSDTIIDETVHDFHLDYGKRIITIIAGKKVIFAIIHDNKATNRIKLLFKPLLKEFEQEYYKEALVGEPGPVNLFDPFKERIAELLGLAEYSLDWIPIVNKDHDHNILLNSPLMPVLKSNLTIKEMIEQSKMSEREVVVELSKLWIASQINFRNILKAEDFVLTTNKITNFLKSSTEEYKDLSRNFPNLKTDLPFLISYFDGRTSVEQIIANFHNEGIDHIFWLIDYLYIQEAIVILPPEKRRILMTKEILETIISIAEEQYGKAKVLETIRTALRECNVPEIVSQIKLNNNQITIDYSFKLYEGLNPRKILEIYNEWLEFLRLFIFSISEKKRKKFIEKLTEELNYDFFNKYRSEDLDGFEEFAFWLEAIFS